MNAVKLVVFSVYAFVTNIEAFNSMGPVRNLIINSIHECPENERPTSDETTWTVRVNDDNGIKSITGTMNLTTLLDNSISYFFILKKWENGSWKKYYDHKGKLCTDVQKLVPKFWGKVVPSIKPDPGRKCPAQPDTYTVTNLHIKSKELDISSIFYGRLLLQMTADKDNNNFFCAMVELDSQATM